MARYKKKPVIIEAFQYGLSNKESTPDWFLESINNGTSYYDSSKLYISTLEGVLHVSVGDCIIKGVNGELYPCKPDIFEKTYEKVGD